MRKLLMILVLGIFLISFVNASLIAHYKFDETEGTDAADDTGNFANFSGFNFDGDEWVTGKFDNAVKLDGINDYFESSGFYWLNDTNFTIAFWLNVQNDSGSYGIVTNRDSGADSWGIEKPATGPKVAFNWGATVTSRENFTDIIENQWERYIIRRNNTNFTLWKNTDQVASFNNSYEPSNDNLKIVIGRSWVNLDQKYANITLDDLMVYDHALTDDEIREGFPGTSINITVLAPTGTISSRTFDLNYDIQSALNLSYCYFNITRGASTEISNTVLDISSYPSVNYTNITVSSDADYKINTWCNDSSSLGQYSQASFTVDTTGNATGGGGGGGGGTSITIVGMTDETRWTMTTQQGGGIFDFNMAAGVSRGSSIKFENKGTTNRDIVLTCEDSSNGTAIELCPYLIIEDAEFSLPLAEISTFKDFQINLPETIPDGDYSIVVIGTDDLNQQGKLTINIQVKSSITGIIFSKIFSSKKIGETLIPYFLIFLVSLVAITGILSRVFDKKMGGRIIISLMIGLFVSFGIVYFI